MRTKVGATPMSAAMPSTASIASPTRRPAAATAPPSEIAAMRDPGLLDEIVGVVAGEARREPAQPSLLGEDLLEPDVAALHAALCRRAPACWRKLALRDFG